MNSSPASEVESQGAAGWQWEMHAGQPCPGSQLKEEQQVGRGTATGTEWEKACGRKRAWRGLGSLWRRREGELVKDRSRSIKWFGSPQWLGPQIGEGERQISARGELPTERGRLA